jgi:hypothetical protein
MDRTLLFPLLEIISFSAASQYRIFFKEKSKKN